MTTALTGVDAPLFLSVTQFSSRFGLSRTHVYDLLREGRLQAIRLGTATRIPMSEVERVQREGC